MTSFALSTVRFLGSFLFFILRGIVVPHCQGSLIRNKMRQNLYSKIHWKRMDRCHGVFAKRPVCDQTINEGKFNKFTIGPATPKVHVTAFAAMLESTPSLFCVESILGDHLYIHTGICTIH